MVGKLLQDAPVAVLAPGGVVVVAQEAQARELLLQQLHHPLGADPEGFERRGAAVVAAILQRLPVVAPMAAQNVLPGAGTVTTMHRKGQRTVGTHHRFPATAAIQKRAVSPTRHKHHSLLTAITDGLQPVPQGPADGCALPLSQLLSHVHHPNRGELATGHPLLEP